MVIGQHAGHVAIGWYGAPVVILTVAMFMLGSAGLASCRPSHSHWSEGGHQLVMV